MPYFANTEAALAMMPARRPDLLIAVGPQARQRRAEARVGHDPILLFGSDVIVRR
jgi:hypothetical protein